MVFMTDYRLMHVKIIAESAILSTFIKLPVVIKIFVLSILSCSFTQVLLFYTKEIVVVLFELNVPFNNCSVIYYTVS